MKSKDVIQNIKQYPTWIGYTALLFWALAAPFVVQIKSLPIFESLTVIFLISFLLSAVKLSFYQEWLKLKQPWFIWVGGVLGIYGNDILYITAFKHAPAAHADLINYLWPVMVILFTSFLPNEQLSKRHILAATLGFMGIYVLLLSNTHQGFEHRFLIGYVCAFLDAVVWALYTVMARRYSQTPVESIGIYCGIAALCSLVFHLKLETFIFPTASQWGVLLLMGATTQCLAYFFWEYGVKQGDFKLLTVLSYGNPMLSIFLLICCGMAKPSVQLVIATLLISLAGIVGIMPWGISFKMGRNHDYRLFDSK